MRIGVLLAIALVAGGTACDESAHRPDASITCHCDAARPRDASWDPCNKISQGGCPVMERCTLRWLSVDPIQGFNTCAYEGIKELGEPCTIDPIAEVDDCVGGTICYSVSGVPDRCSSLCSTLGGVDTCAIGTCQVVPGFGEGEGICVE